MILYDYIHQNNVEIASMPETNSHWKTIDSSINFTMYRPQKQKLHDILCLHWEEPQLLTSQIYHQKPPIQEKIPIL